MHNLVIAKDIFNKLSTMVEPGRNIKKAYIKVGEMAIVGHDPADIKEAFIDLAKGTQFEKIELAVEVIKMKTVCEECGKEYDFNEQVFECSKCGNSDFKLITGEELVIDKIE